MPIGAGAWLPTRSEPGPWRRAAASAIDSSSRTCTDLANGPPYARSPSARPSPRPCGPRSPSSSPERHGRPRGRGGDRVHRHRGTQPHMARRTTALFGGRGRRSSGPTGPTGRRALVRAGRGACATTRMTAQEDDPRCSTGSRDPEHGHPGGRSVSAPFLTPVTLAGWGRRITRTPSRLASSPTPATPTLASETVAGITRFDRPLAARLDAVKTTSGPPASPPQGVVIDFDAIDAIGPRPAPWPGVGSAGRRKCLRTGPEAAVEIETLQVAGPAARRHRCRPGV